MIPPASYQTKSYKAPREEKAPHSAGRGGTHTKPTRVDRATGSGTSNGGAALTSPRYALRHRATSSALRTTPGLKSKVRLPRSHAPLNKKFQSLVVKKFLGRKEERAGRLKARGKPRLGSGRWLKRGIFAYRGAAYLLRYWLSRNSYYHMNRGHCSAPPPHQNKHRFQKRHSARATL